MCVWGRTNLARDQLLDCIKSNVQFGFMLLGECIVLRRARGLNNCIIKFLAKRNTEFYVQLDWY